MVGLVCCGQFAKRPKRHFNIMVFLVICCMLFSRKTLFIALIYFRGLYSVFSFRPSTSNDEQLGSDFADAEKEGKESGDCKSLHPQCPQGLFQMFTSLG